MVGRISGYDQTCRFMAALVEDRNTPLLEGAPPHIQSDIGNVDHANRFAQIAAIWQGFLDFWPSCCAN